MLALPAKVSHQHRRLHPCQAIFRHWRGAKIGWPLRLARAACTSGFYEVEADNGDE